MYGVFDALNYSIDFSYAEDFAHRLDHAGQRYYSYDDDGNVVRERNEAMPDSSSTDIGSDDDEWDDWDDWDDDWGDGLGEAGFGFGMGGNGSGSDSGSGSGSSGGQATVYERIYEWDECDRLTGSTEGKTVVGYVYGEDGNRTNKYSSIGETLYFSSMWTWHDAKSLGSGGQTTKNIYLGTERIVSKLNRGKGHDTYSEEYLKTYYWHTDHLGSAHFITDYQGNEYQRIEYTPYGEEWVELKPDAGEVYMPYRFTGKERDEETGLYYYGARYLDPVYSRWLSTDPAVGDYLPSAPTSDDARKRNLNLPGMGGVFNTIDSCLYSYSGNNPIRYIDPDGWEHGIPSDIEKKLSYRKFMTTSITNGTLSPIEIANIIFNETRSMSGEGIGIARKELAHAIINADVKWGEKRMKYAGTQPTTANPPKAEMNIYTGCLQAADEAVKEYNEGIDPTEGAYFFNMRITDSKTEFQNQPVRTHSGPFSNSYSKYKYINTYGPEPKKEDSPNEIEE